MCSIRTSITNLHTPGSADAKTAARNAREPAPATPAPYSAAVLCSSTRRRNGGSPISVLKSAYLSAALGVASNPSEARWAWMRRSRSQCSVSKRTLMLPFCRSEILTRGVRAMHVAHCPTIHSRHKRSRHTLRQFGKRLCHPRLPPPLWTDPRRECRRLRAVPGSPPAPPSSRARTALPQETTRRCLRLDPEQARQGPLRPPAQ